MDKLLSNKWLIGGLVLFIIAFLFWKMRPKTKSNDVKESTDMAPAVMPQNAAQTQRLRSNIAVMNAQRADTDNYAKLSSIA